MDNERAFSAKWPPSLEGLMKKNRTSEKMETNERKMEEKRSPTEHRKLAKYFIVSVYSN